MMKNDPYEKDGWNNNGRTCDQQTFWIYESSLKICVLTTLEVSKIMKSANLAHTLNPSPILAFLGSVSTHPKFGSKFETI
jgi:hypothetical protein